MQRVLAIASASAVFTAPLRAQAMPLETGSRIRVVTADSGMPTHYETGVLLSLSPDSVRYTRDADSMLVVTTLGRNRSLERYAGLESHGAEGFFLGALAGGLISAGTKNSYSNEDGGLQGTTTLFGVGLMGLLVGAAAHSEHWVPITTSGLDIHVVTVGSGVGLSLRRADVRLGTLDVRGRP